MKIKTLIIAPYPAMTHLLEECRHEYKELDIHIEVANLQEALPVAKAAEDRGFDVIISRGGTSKLIEEAVTIPVIDIHVSGYDMLRVLTLANDFPGKKAIVGFSNITLGGKAIKDLLEIQIDVFTVEEAKEVDSLVEKLKIEGYELIMGDVITMDAALKHNVEGILIQSGREAIFEAFQKAKSIYRLHRSQQLQINLLHSLIEETESNMIVLSQDGRTVYQNWTDFKSCPLPITKLTQQIEESDLSNEVNIIETGEKQQIKQRIKKKEINNQTYYLFLFSGIITQQVHQQGFHVETISQQPMLISNSQSMKRCVSMIDRSLKSSQWLLLGAEGTGKQLISQYIHYRKHTGNGLYANVTAQNLLAIQDGIDPDICTLYINDVEVLSMKEVKKLSSVVQKLKRENLTVILGLSNEEEVYHSLIYHEDILTIHIPSLKARREDVRPLATYFIAFFHGQIGTSAIKMKEEAMDLLEQYSWPGNVAQLKSLLHAAVLGERGYVIGKRLIQQQLEEEKDAETITADKEFLSGTLEEIEKRVIEHIMQEENYNQTRAADRLGINRSTLWRKLKQ
ncbi:sigma 54-interacting transcriptional regulator [Bacillus haikouensis]|uniref:sigma-54-dependent transcriptional regulator n=1 Tax=Bacillus haikouensis TaxID=1510468 RepID=UPI0015550F30|nr:sigma-54-dependent transcriptional regulator [Bacillus haikouensis]NQD64380.1 sigma 54-interacting transcriptional regulator [Bacillus haikouensis]